MDAEEAIRLRRSVRSYTDQPVDDKDISAILRLALLAPTGGMAQAWSFIVVRDTELREAVAEIVIRGGAKYFETVRPAGPDVSPDEHAEWARGYAEQVLGNYRHVPVWIVGMVVPRHAFPDDQAEWERVADLVSVGFAMENLFVAARARGLGTVPRPRARAATKRFSIAKPTDTRSATRSHSAWSSGNACRGTTMPTIHTGTWR